MAPVTALQVATLHKRPEAVRNICILAHIDHGSGPPLGKTTLSDSLLSANGIISSKLAGKVRYLDSREDEQERGITMKASAISLYFNVIHRAKDQTEQKQEYLINLIDSPGHVDFSSEVSTAVRLCDGALVLVDVVEGVSTQTMAVLRQAWVENVKPCLVLNKIDRLIVELRMTPEEAHMHLQNIVEQVNAIMGSLFAGDLADASDADMDAVADGAAEGVECGADTVPLEERVFDWSLEDKDDSEIYFAPERGNVVFASAADGWAFSIDQFAQLYSDRLGIKEEVLRKTLWGDWYLDAKNKRVVGREQGKGRFKPMFVQFVLENLWAVYDAAMLRPDPARVEKIVTTLKLKVLPRDLKSKDGRMLAQLLLSQWLPLAPTVLLMVVRSLPSPRAAQPVRASGLLFSKRGDRTITRDTYQVVSTKPEMATVERAIARCAVTPDDMGTDTPTEVPTIAFVAKMVAMPPESLPTNRRVLLSAEELRERRRRAKEAEQAATAAGGDLAGPAGEVLPTAPKADAPAAAPEPAPTPAATPAAAPTTDEVFIGFARVFSGVLRAGQEIWVLGPRYTPESPMQYATRVRIRKLYLFMGRDLEELDEVPAGNIVGIEGLSEHVLKYATLSTILATPSFGQLYRDVAPIVRVALEPSNPSKLPQLKEGLRLLSQADPSVEVIFEESGEHVLVTAGELHLERCMKDLRERFAKINIDRSPPIVPFRETLMPGTEEGTSPANALSPDVGDMGLGTQTHGFAVADASASGRKTATARVLTANRKVAITFSAKPLPPNLYKYLEKAEKCLKQLTDQLGDRTNIVHNDDTRRIMDDLQQAFESEGPIWAALLPRLWSFGPKRVGPNMLFNVIPGYATEGWTSPFVETTGMPSPAPTLVADDNDACEPTAEAADGAADLLAASTAAGAASTVSVPSSGRYRGEYDSAIVYGFQLAVASGPLCEEPMAGVAFFVDAVHTQAEQDSVEATWGELGKSGGPTYGQMISATKDACRQAFLGGAARLMLAEYSCVIQATAEVLGKVYGVLNKRRGDILSERLKDGTSIFHIHATLPVVESFGFADEIRSKTSGLASPQLVFRGWRVFEQDPFWVPTTEEELEDLGEKADRENVARRYMVAVRRRKGLSVDDKIVQSAEKQKTLSRK